MSRNFPPSASLAAMASTLATQIADLECAADQSDEAIEPFTKAFSTTEKRLILSPVQNVGDLLLKLEVLAKLAEDSVITKEECRTIARDVERLNGPGMSFNPEAWLRRWTHKGGGYVRTDIGLSFVAPEPVTFQQRLLLDELQRAQGQQAVADLLDGTTQPVPARGDWTGAKARYEAAHADADAASLACEVALPAQRSALIAASDEANSAEYKAWQLVMKAEAPDYGAVLWKLIELFGEAGRDRIKGSIADAWLFQFTDVIMADVERLNGAGQ